MFGEAPSIPRFVKPNGQGFGVACVARLLRTHRDVGHDHVAAEANSGVLIPAFMNNSCTTIDEVIFHGEVASLKTLDYNGATIQLLDCRLDFGDRGELHLPVYVPAAKPPQPEIDPARPGDFVCGVGCLQLLQL